MESTAAKQLEHLRAAAELGGLAVSNYVLPVDRHVLVGTHRFHYLDWRAREGSRAVLLLHGGGLTAHTWDLVCLSLQPEYHCLALDLRGHGDSEWSAAMEYSREAHAADIEGLVDLLDLDDFVLVGMSLGGLNALEYAARHSDRLRALVLVDVGPEIQMRGAERIREFITQDAEFDSVEEVVELARKFNKSRRPELLRTSLLFNLLKLPDGKWTWKYDRRAMSRINPEAMIRSLRALAKRLPAITCATLVVRGERSDVFSDEDAEKVAARVPNARWVKVSNAGHTVQGDNPRGLVDAMRAFFTEVGA